MPHVLLYVTAADAAEATRIGRALVEERLAACANVMPGTTAIFRWDGEMKTASEAVLILKTNAANAIAATARVKALHSYSCPCVAVLPIDGGNADFLAWIDRETLPDRGR